MTPPIDQGPFRKLRRYLDSISRQKPISYGDALLSATPLLQEVLEHKRWLNRFCRAFATASTFRYPIWVGVDGDYTVFAQQFGSMQCSSIHDHKTWGLVGVWQGEECEERFLLRGHERPKSAVIDFVDETVNRAGTVTHLLPLEEDIHRIRNIRRRPAYSIHIYGRRLVDAEGTRFVIDEQALKARRRPGLTLPARRLREPSMVVTLQRPPGAAVSG